MVLLTRTLVLTLGLCTSALSIPTEPLATFHTLRYQSPQTLLISQKPFSPWAQLRDAFVHKLWGLSPSPGSQPSSWIDEETIRARYGGDLVLRFKIKTAEEARALAEAANTLYLDVWEASQDWVDLRIAKDTIEPFLSLLPTSLHHAHSPVMHDLPQAILDNYPAASVPQQSATQFHAFKDVSHSLDQSPSTATKDLFFKDYQPFSVTVSWMRFLASLYPGHVQLINVGVSYEGRNIPALRIGVRPLTNPDPSKPRDTILITGGSHAREWISTSAVNYIAYSLIAHYGKSRDVARLLEEFDWVFVPTLNPDGYIYTWEHDRLWRKNRQRTSVSFCPGIDLGRSFGFHWDGEAAGNNPCLEDFAGEGPFDAVEADQFALWAKNETDNNNVKFAAFLDLHSYSEEILYPYSFSCDQLPPSLENLQELGMDMAKAIRLTHNRIYAVTSACDGSTVVSRQSAKAMWPTMEPNGGSALDWFYHELAVKYSYQIKLRDTGSYGFLLPSNRIVPTGQEMYNAIVELGDFLLSNKGIELSADRDERLASRASR